MTRYPSVTSLTVNAVGEMVRRTSATRIAAVAPTEARSADDEAGYPIRYAAATRLVVQVRAPQYRHAERGPCFELTPGAIGTLSMREAPGTAMVACPGIEGMSELPEALDATRFVAVHALRSDTSRLFVPADGPVTAKIRDASDADGFDRDPANYYPVPANAVYSWSDLVDELTDTTGDLLIRDGGSPTDRYTALVERLRTLHTLYPRPNPRRSTPAPRASLDEAGADRLIDHAVAAYENAYAGAGPTSDPTAERHALETVVEAMRATRDPALFRIRRALEVITEMGDQTEETMLLGVDEEDATDDSGVSTMEKHARPDTTTLADFI